MSLGNKATLFENGICHNSSDDCSYSYHHQKYKPLKCYQEVSVALLKPLHPRATLFQFNILSKMVQCLPLLANYDFVVQNNKSDTITKVHYISPFLINFNILLVSRSQNYKRCPYMMQ